MCESMCGVNNGPERATKRQNCVGYLTWFWGNFIVDLFFICDIVVNFRTGFVREGHFVNDGWLAAKA